MNVNNINSVQGLLKIVKTFRANSDPHYKDIWFRGASDSSYELIPGRFRKEFLNYKLADCHDVRERHLNQDFRVLAAGDLPSNVQDEDIYFLMQHYGMPTRLLDWSTSALTALYFATKDFVTEKADLRLINDGIIWIMNPFRVSETQKKENLFPSNYKSFNGVATSRNRIYIDAIESLMKWNEEKQVPNCIFPIRPGYIDHRVSLQKSCFTFHGNDLQSGALKVAHNDSLVSYTIPKRKKIDIQKELAYMGIDEFTIYGGLNSLSNSLKLGYQHAFLNNVQKKKP